jgi:hypothetical protein
VEIRAVAFWSISRQTVWVVVKSEIARQKDVGGRGGRVFLCESVRVVSVWVRDVRKRERLGGEEKETESDREEPQRGPTDGTGEEGWWEGVWSKSGRQFCRRE